MLFIRWTSWFSFQCWKYVFRILFILLRCVVRSCSGRGSSKTAAAVCRVRRVYTPVLGH